MLTAYLAVPWVCCLGSSSTRSNSFSRKQQVVLTGFDLSPCHMKSAWPLCSTMWRGWYLNMFSDSSSFLLMSLVYFNRWCVILSWKLSCRIMLVSQDLFSTVVVMWSGNSWCNCMLGKVLCHQWCHFLYLLDWRATLHWDTRNSYYRLKSNC